MSAFKLDDLLKIGSAALQTTATTLCEAINELVGKIPTVARTTAAASSTVIKKQQVKVGSTDYDIDGTAYMEQGVFLSASDPTVVTFTNDLITGDKAIDVYFTKWGCVPEDVSVTNGTCAVTFPADEDESTGIVRIYIK